MGLITVTTENFEETIKEGVAIIKFGAKWCGPCRQMAPIMESVATEDTTTKYGDVDTDEQPELSQQFGIRSVPTTLVFKDGELVETLVGVQTKQQLLEKAGA